MANLKVRNLRELYQQLGLPIDYLEEESGFTIHYLEKLLGICLFVLIISVFCLLKVHSGIIQ